MIDLTKSSFLLPDLMGIISNLSALNKIDTTLNKITLALSHFTSNPKEVNPDELKGVLEVARSIADSYDREGQSIAKSITVLFEEIDHLALSASIVEKTALMNNIDSFYKLANDLPSVVKDIQEEVLLKGNEKKKYEIQLTLNEIKKSIAIIEERNKNSVGYSGIRSVLNRRIHKILVQDLEMMKSSLNDIINGYKWIE